MLNVEKKIRTRVKRQMEKTQREYYLNEQMKAIQRELGEQDDQRDELMDLEKRIKKTKLSKEARTKGRGRAEEAAQHEPDVRRIDGGAELPRLAAVDPMGCRQGQADRPRQKAERHPRTRTTTALEKVKERILEYLAVQARTGQQQGADPGASSGLRASARPRSASRSPRPPGVRFARLSLGRRAGRGGDPRPPPHLHRLDARQGHPVDEEG